MARISGPGGVRLRLAAIRFAAAIALVGVAGGVLPVAVPAVLADAPGLAIVRYDTPLLSAPDASAEPIMMIEAGSQVELTGGTAVGYLHIRSGNRTGWVTAHALSVSGSAGIPTAVTPDGTVIQDAPLPNANVLGEVPPGGVVILTGAHVGIYVAGSFEGIGGWIEEADLNVPYDADGNAR
jgi:hypothetical protein